MTRPLNINQRRLVELLRENPHFCDLLQQYAAGMGATLDWKPTENAAELSHRLLVALKLTADFVGLFIQQKKKVN